MLSNITSTNVSSSIKSNSYENKRLDNIEDEISTLNTEIKNIKEVNEQQTKNITTNTDNISSLFSCAKEDSISKSVGRFNNVTADIENVNTENVNTLNVTNEIADNIKTTSLTADSLTSGKATISDLEINTENVATSNITDLTANNVNAKSISTSDFSIENFATNNINTDNIDANTIIAGNANIETVITNNISAENISTKNIDTSVATITDATIANKEYNDTNIVLGTYLTSQLTTDYEVITDFFTIIKTGKVFHIIQSTPGYVWAIFDDKDTYTIELKQTGYQAKIRYIGNIPVTNDDYEKGEKTITFDLLTENKRDVVVTASQTLLGCLSAQITGCICCYDDLWVDNLRSQNYSQITIKDPVYVEDTLTSNCALKVNCGTLGTCVKAGQISFSSYGNYKGGLTGDSLSLNKGEVGLTSSGLIVGASCENPVTIEATNASLPNTTINGNACVTGDLSVTGTMYCTHAEDLNVNCCEIITRSNATSAMADTEHSGLKVCMGLSDANDLYVVAKNDGQLYIGKETSLQPIATRTDLSDGCYTKYDATNKTLVNAKDPLANLSTDDLVCYDGNNLAAAKQICLAGETGSYSLITPVAMWSSNGTCQSKINPTHICLTDGTNTTYMNASQICVNTLTADTINGSIECAKQITDGTAIVKAENNNELNMYPATSGDKTWINYRGGSSNVCIGNGSGSLGTVYANAFIGTASCATNADWASCADSSTLSSYATNAKYATSAGTANCATTASVAYSDQNGVNIVSCYAKKQSTCNTAASVVYGCLNGTVLCLFTC